MVSSIQGMDIQEMLRQSNPEFAMEGAAQFQGDKNARNTRTLTYWRRCAGVTHNGEPCRNHNGDGWLMVGPWPNKYTMYEVEEFQKVKHATRLDDTFIAPQQLPGGTWTNVTEELKNPDTRWIPLIRNGGIREMPIEQMVALGWHRYPAYRSAVPELVQYQDIYCEYGCPRTGRDARVFVSEDGYKNHISVAHRDVQAPKAIGDVLTKYLAEASKTK